MPYYNTNKLNNEFIKNENINSKIKISAKTVLSNHSKNKNKTLNEENNNNIKEKPKISKISKKTFDNHNSKNYTYSKYDYNNLDLKKNKPDCCTKTAIISILIFIIILQIVALPLIINLYDFSV